ncbi:MAG: polysaccharide lyase family 8 super-sandwich domain-containing protein [Niastella sp.]|uniref:polysaccharide lyase family 8 super-sandwich domain-containing protein n=1 Tax=Niastella sp. TaxID=1869183 RepID=UPI00389A1EE1
MLKVSILVAWFLSSAVFCHGYNHADNRHQEAIDTVTQRLLAIYLKDTVDVVQVQRYAAALQAGGNWPDLSFVDRSLTHWDPVTHLERLHTMALAYCKPSTEWYNDKQLFDKIIAGLDYYFSEKPVAKNWWFNQIGAPQEYMVVLLLLKGKIQPDKLLMFSSLLKDETGNERHRFKNRTWVSSITIHKGCIENNAALVQKGFTSFASTLVVVPEQGIEGIKADYSVHQHHEQLYSGGYGLSFLDDVATFMLLAQGTSFAAVFTPQQKALLVNLLLNGTQLFGYRGTIDFGTTGRGISRPGHTENISGKLLDKMVILDPPHAADYQAWKAHVSGAAYPSRYQGNKHFWKADIMTQHGAGYYLSAKIISKRTLGTESLNGENGKGYYLPLGATNILIHGNEYQNIFPVWDWTKVPGTTAGTNGDSTSLVSYLYGANDFGGGVSNAKAGVMAFDGNYRGIRAKKAYFFFNDEMLCLGAGISSTRKDPITTAVNQCFLSGAVIAAEDNAGQTLSPGKASFNHLRWLYHDGVGYIFPAQQTVCVKQEPQSGSWREINEGGSAMRLQQPVFSVWIEHGSQPANSQYAYLVVPNTSLTNFKKRVAKSTPVIVRNDTTVQAVSSGTGKLNAVVFYQPAVVVLPDGLQLRADKPVMVLLQQTNDAYYITVSDPLYTQKDLTLTINKPLKGEEATVNGAYTNLHIAFPPGDTAGQSYSKTYKNLHQ